MGIFDKIFGKEKKDSFKNVIFTPRDTDIFIVSYPKSGNTWARFLIGNYITDNNFTFLNSNDIIPDMHALPEKCNELKGMRIIKSHFSFKPEFKNVIYIVRDARDVAVSYYYYYLKYVYNNQVEKPTFEKFLHLFLKGEVGYGLWDNHVNLWLDQAPTRFLLIRYEDMITDTENVARQMLKFIFGSYNEEKMKKDVQATSFEQMAGNEKKERMLLQRNAASDPSISFVRKGQPGDYKHYFSEKMEKELLHAFGSTMKRLNYIN